MLQRLARRGFTQGYEEFYYCIEEFNDGLKLLSENQMDLAEDKFKLCIEKTAQKKYLGENPHNLILKYLALVQRSQGKSQECEISLEQIADNLQYKNSPDRFSAYMNLIRQTLTSNIPKALKISQAHHSSVPPELKPEFNFLYGVINKQTALLLNDYFLEGKKCLSDCLTEDLSINNAYVLHNLACGQWWHAKLVGNEEIDKDDQILVDFKQVLPNFSKAIRILEGLDHDFNVEKDPLTNEVSSISALNVAELFLQAGILPVTPKQMSIKWVKAALEQGIKKQFLTNGKAFMLLGVIFRKNQDVPNSEKCFKTALEFLKGSENFEHFMTLSAYEFLIRSSNPSLADELKLNAEGVLTKLSPWSEKVSQALIPIWHI